MASLLRFSSFLLTTTLNLRLHILPNDICLWQEYLQCCCSLSRQPSNSKPWSEHTRLQHFSLLTNFPHQLHWGSGWWWWLLWLSSLNFNPQHSAVLNWIELYVLLMMAKFHTWKGGFVVCMKDPVSPLSLSPCFFLLTSPLCFLPSALSWITYPHALFWLIFLISYKVVCHRLNGPISFSRLFWHCWWQ